MAKIDSSGADSVSSLTDVQISGAASGDILQLSAGLLWENKTPANAGLVTIAGTQSVTGSKTFTDNLVIDNAKELRLSEADSNGSSYIGFVAPPALSGNITWTVPPAAVANGYWVSDVSGVLACQALNITHDSTNYANLALLVGRSSGQTLRGGTGASENLTLDSTNSSTKGTVKVAAGSPLVMVSQNEVRFCELAANGSNYVAVIAPASISSNYSFTLPATGGTSNQVLISSDGAGTSTWVTVTSLFDHGDLGGRSDDDHTIYALLAGRSGGQTYIGGTGSGESLTLASTAHATKGGVVIEGGSYLAVAGASGVHGELRLYEATGGGTDYIAFRAQAMSASYTLKWPQALPASDGYTIYVNADGTMSFGAPSGGGGGGAITVQELDGSPSVVAATILQFDQTSGFIVSNPSGTTALVTINAMPVNCLAPGTNGQVLVTSGGVTTWGSIGVAGGGTGITTYTAGDILYASGTTTLSKLAIGASNSLLGVSGSAPAWLTTIDNSSMIFRIGAGSAGSPTHSFSTATSSGMFLAAAATLGFATGGTSRMTIDSVGQVYVKGFTNTTIGLGIEMASGASADPFAIYDNTPTRKFSITKDGYPKFPDGNTMAALGCTLVENTTTAGIHTDADIRVQNVLINPNFRFFQEHAATSTACSDGAYCADQWYTLTQTASVNASQGTDSTLKGGYYLRLTQNQASAQRMGACQVLEGRDCQHLRGLAVCFQAKVKISNSQAVRIAIVEWTGTTDSPTKDVVNDWTSSTYTTGNFFKSTTTTVTAVSSLTPSAATWTDISVTGTISSSANNVFVFIWTEGTAAQNVTLDFADTMLDVGDGAKSWRFDGEGIDIRRCERFFQKSDSADTAVLTASRQSCTRGVQNNVGVGEYYVSVDYRTVMRASPTVTIYGYTSATTTVTSNGSGTNFGASSGAVSLTNEKGFTLQNSSAGALTMSSNKLVMFNWYSDARL